MTVPVPVAIMSLPEHHHQSINNFKHLLESKNCTQQSHNWSIIITTDHHNHNWSSMTCKLEYSNKFVKTSLGLIRRHALKYRKGTYMWSMIWKIIEPTNNIAHNNRKSTEPTNDVQFHTNSLQHSMTCTQCTALVNSSCSK